MADFFKRYEVKYLINKKQYNDLKSIMTEHMILDKFGLNTINNVYFDTPNYQLIRSSIEKPCYKEKLRVRSYGNNSENGFIELKKKYKGIVYKRRIELPQEEIFDYLSGKKYTECSTQIIKEIDYFLSHYENLQPSMFLSYKREAFYGIEHEDFRVTFDHDIKMRINDISLKKNGHETKVSMEDMVLLEVKTVVGLPKWLLSFFSDHKIYKTSFSKYGYAYKEFILADKFIDNNENKEGEGGNGDVA